jgi:hypothetical protein
MEQMKLKNNEDVDVLEKPEVKTEATEERVSTPVSTQEKLAAEALKRQETSEKVEEKKGLLKRLFGKKEKLTPEQRMANWTPKHKAAIEFLSNINDKWAKSLEQMGDAQVDKIEEFVKNPANLNFTSVYYDESENKYKSKGGIATAGL